jgi:beta-1,4-mannosyltransferase
MKNIVIYPYYSENPYQDMIENNIGIDDVNFINIQFKSVLNIIFYLVGLKKADIIHFHWINNITQTRNPIVSIVLTLLFSVALTLNYFFIKATVCYTMHNRRSHYKKLVFLDRIFTKFVVFVSQYVIVHAEFQRRYVNKRFGKNISNIIVMKHGVYDLPHVKHSEKTVITADMPVFLYFGRITEYKNLLEVAGIITRKNCKLIILGKCTSASITTALLTLMDKSPNVIEWENREFTETELILKSYKTNYIVLPQPEVFTSGSAMLALSLAKPILAHQSEFYTEVFGKCIVQYNQVKCLESMDPYLRALDITPVDDLKLLEAEYKWSRTIVPLRNIYMNVLCLQD